MLEALFPKELIRQEVSQDRYTQIPEQVRDVYCLYRPSGSHKPNAAIARAHFIMKEVEECKI
jgi:predicted alternative tryptophan synthase beta-subunit